MSKATATQSSTAPDAVPAVSSASGRILVAIEMSKKSWILGIHSDLSAKISLYTIAAGDTTVMLRLIDAERDRLQRAGRTDVRVLTGYEAGRDGFWLHRFLSGRGIASRVLDSASIQVNRRARRAKTDRLDAESLIRVLMALDRGETKAASVVHVPSVEDEDARRPGRERDALLQERTRLTNRIIAHLFQEGVRDLHPARPDWLDRAREAQTGDGRAMPSHVLAQLSREKRRLDLVNEQIAEIAAERRQRLAETETPTKQAVIAQKLMRIKGIGENIADVLAHEIFVKDFDNRRQVAGYAGLTPSPYASGMCRREQGISKAGNPRVRETMIELGWFWLRHQPDSQLSQWFSQYLGQTRGTAQPEAKRRMRKMAIVALSRKLLVALWRFVMTGVIPEGVVLKAA